MGIILVDIWRLSGNFINKFTQTVKLCELSSFGSVYNEVNPNSHKFTIGLFCILKATLRGKKDLILALVFMTINDLTLTSMLALTNT